MEKYASVDWLAQSHHGITTRKEHREDAAADSGKPHLPCLVQPTAPSRGKSCLELKISTKSSEDRETRDDSDSCPSSSPHSKSSGYSSDDDCKLLFAHSEKGEKLMPRRVRTKFTADQLFKLEKIFQKNKYLDMVRRIRTAQKLDLSETQVRTWFQNRRMKMKREMQDSFNTSIPPEAFRHILPAPYCNVPAQPPHFAALNQAFYYTYPLPQMPLQPHMAPHLLPHHAPYY